MTACRKSSAAKGVGSLCIRETVILRPDETVRTASRLMRDHVVGSVIVMDGGQPVGILTDRDIAIRVVSEARDADTTPVGTVMSSPVVTVPEYAAVGEALRRMRAHRIRRLPVVNEAGTLAGILSLDDLLDLLAEELEAMAHLIRSQGEPPPKGP